MNGFQPVIHKRVTSDIHLDGLESQSIRFLQLRTILIQSSSVERFCMELEDSPLADSTGDLGENIYL
jgi:hypothetical protein